MANTRKTSYVSLSGGVNITTPTLEIPEGDFIYALNMEPNKTNGIKSAQGYERIDGNHTDPSNVTLNIYTYENLTGTTPVQGDSVTSGANTYTVCGISDTEIYLVTQDTVVAAGDSFTTSDGGFDTTSHRFIQRLRGSQYPPSLLTVTEKSYYNYAVENQRAVIDEVPGAGAVKGVFQDPNNGRLLAVRRNVADTEDILWEAVAGSGWTQVAGTSFTNSTYYRFQEITQRQTSRRLYITNGIDALHSYDSTGPTVATYTVGELAGKAPEHIEYHNDRVVVSYGNLLIWSSRETPDFDVANGAGVESVNYDITGLTRLVNDALCITTTNSVHTLYGNPEDDPVTGAPPTGEFKENTSNTGALENTIDSSDYPYFINRFGINNLIDTLKSGDLQINRLSDKISPIINVRYDDAGLPVVYIGAIIDRENDIYRVYRSDGISFCMLRDEERFYPVTINDYKVELQCLGRLRTDDKDYILAGSADGYVLKLEEGGSLDGTKIIHSIKTPYIHLNTPAINKRFFKFTLDVLAPNKVDVVYKADYNLGSSRYSEQLTLEAISGQARFDQSTFNAATWSNTFVDEVGGYLNGSGTTVSLNINIESLNIEPFVIQGLIYHYKTRGLKR